MANAYNAIQGRSLERLAALSDGIFAVAMTLLVLDIHIPRRSMCIQRWSCCIPWVGWLRSGLRT